AATRRGKAPVSCHLTPPRWKFAARNAAKFQYAAIGSDELETHRAQRRKAPTRRCRRRRDRDFTALCAKPARTNPDERASARYFTDRESPVRARTAPGCTRTAPGRAPTPPGRTAPGRARTRSNQTEPRESRDPRGAPHAAPEPRPPPLPPRLVAARPPRADDRRAAAPPGPLLPAAARARRDAGRGLPRPRLRAATT